MDDAVPDVSAGFWLRSGGYMIDGVLVAAVSVFLNLVLPSALSIVMRIALSAAYFTVVPVLYRGQTLGKMAAGTAMIQNDGSPVTYGRAFARWLGYLLSGLTFCLGFACAAFTKNKRALHDYVAGTRVVRVEELAGGRKLAVTLMGLLFPLLMIAGVGAALLLPKLAGIEGVSAESGEKGRLAELRSALSIYYGDAKGVYPADLNALAPKYLPEIPETRAPDHPGAAGVEVYGAEVCGGANDPGGLVAAKLRDTGKWGYVAAPKSPCDGKLFIDCTHPDLKGVAWYTY
jgi:uncharacterized RDD family membrane protein YckC